MFLLMHVSAAACPYLTTAHSDEAKHDGVYDEHTVSVKETLDLVALATSAMKGNAMRIKADESASSKTDCVHPAYEVHFDFESLV
jgi:hypothetical protein